MKNDKSLSSTTQERIRDLLRPVLGEVDDPKAAQMSQAELSRMLGINSATLRRIMSGKTVTKLSNLVMGLGTPAAEQTAQTIDFMKAPIYQANETTLQNEFLTAIRQIKARVGEDRAAQTALFTDETMEQIALQLDKGQLAFIPQMDQHQFAAQLLSPMQGLDGISSESLQDLERAFGNVLNDMKSQYEMSKQSAANEVRRCE